MPCYKDEKTGTWYCQFRYTDFTGAQKQKRKRGFKTRGSAGVGAGISSAESQKL